ncbi:MAG: Gfo/Idh/MocA family oxidoreductase [Saprospiraceae bacterium]
MMPRNKLKKTQGFNRRKFVKTSAIATGGALLIPSLLSAKAHVDGDDAIKVALIGCGGRGTGAAMQALLTQQNVNLVAMADAFRDQLDSCYATLTADDISDWSGAEGSVKERVRVPEEHKFVGFDGYLKAIPLADVVILTTPPGFRPIHFEEAIRQGKHVFTEKPMATDAPGVRKVLAAAEEAKKKKLNVVVGLQRHYQTIYREWVERMQAGAIGDIVTSHVYWNNDGVWVRTREEFSQKAGRPLTEMEYQMRNWYYFNWLCGDHICEQHIHNLDVGNWVKNAYPVRAQGMGGRQVRVGKDFGEIFDHHFIEYEYEDGSRMFSQCRHQPGTMSRVTEVFQGSRGFAPRPGVLVSRSGQEIMKYDDRQDPNPYQVEHDQLFDAIAKGEYRFHDAENGAHATMTSILGRMASYSGNIVEWEAAINSELSIMPAKFSWDAQPPVLPDKEGMYPCAVPGKTKVL